MAQLQDFLRNPVRHFFSQRLKVFFESAEKPVSDVEPFVLDALERYTLSDSLLSAGMASVGEISDTLEKHARKLQGSGLLPMAEFGARLRDELIEPLPDLLERYRQLLVLWPSRLDSALPITFEARGIVLEGWLAGVYQRDDGSCLSVSTIANAIGGVRSRKWHRLVRPWVLHLASCAVGLPLTTAVVASDDTLLLDPLQLDQARTALSDLLLAWQAGMTRPLPVAVKTAVAWLSQTDQEKALAAARKAYEGDGVTSNGERREAVALMRQFADFDALMDSEEFEGWAQTLYQPMLEAPWHSLDERGLAHDIVSTSAGVGLPLAWQPTDRSQRRHRQDIHHFRTLSALDSGPRCGHQWIRSRAAAAADLGRDVHRCGDQGAARADSHAWPKRHGFSGTRSPHRMR